MSEQNRHLPGQLCCCIKQKPMEKKSLVSGKFRFEVIQTGHHSGNLLTCHRFDDILDTRSVKIRNMSGHDVRCVLSRPVCFDSQPWLALLSLHHHGSLVQGEDPALARSGAVPRDTVSPHSSRALGSLQMHAKTKNQPAFATLSLHAESVARSCLT